MGRHSQSTTAHCTPAGVGDSVSVANCFGNSAIARPPPDGELDFAQVGSPHFGYERALDFTQGASTATDDHGLRGSPM